MPAVTEIWKQSSERPDVEVSSFGRVRIYVTGALSGNGYLVVSGGKRNAPKLPIHRMVALEFLGQRPLGMVVRHLNDNRFDNRLENLVYGTPKENWSDGERNGIFKRYCPKRVAVLARHQTAGGAWWKGKKREGCRGKAVRSN